MRLLRTSSTTTAIAVLLTFLTVLLAICVTTVLAWKPRIPIVRPAFGHRFILPNPCVLHDERTGAEFDLTQIRLAGHDYTAEQDGYFYRMNVCGPVSTGGPCGNALVCQYTAKDHTFVAKVAVYDGYFGPRLNLINQNDPTQGVTMRYMNGDICFVGPAKRRTPRTTILQYKCAADTSDKFHIHEDKDSCTFTITLNTPAACWPPGSGDSLVSNGTIFLILLFLVVSVYIACGILYNRSQGKETFADQFPHYEFWTVTLPGLVKDGCIFSWSKFQEFKEKKLKNGAGGLLGGSGATAPDPDDPFHGKGAPTARSDDL